jgi:dolichol-phosphate mannosyltransferase
MDADGSHSPEQLPRLLAGAGDADLVLGSRWVPGGEVVNWPAVARCSAAAATPTPAVLGLPLQDADRRVPGLPPDRPRRAAASASVASQGLLLPGRPGLADLVRRLPLVEVPITFVERVRGESKMSRPSCSSAVAGHLVGLRRGRVVRALPERSRR